MKVQWHPAFCAAMQLTLLDYGEDLEFISEYNLNKKPLELDQKQARELVFCAERESTDLGKVLVDALLHAVVRANSEVFEAGKKEDSNMCEALRELMAPEIAEETAKAREKALAEGRKEGLETGRKEGLETGRKEGLETGREEGLAAGREEGHKTALDNLTATLMEHDPSLSLQAAMEQAKLWLKMA